MYTHRCAPSTFCNFIFTELILASCERWYIESSLKCSAYHSAQNHGQPSLDRVAKYVHQTRIFSNKFISCSATIQLRHKHDESIWCNADQKFGSIVTLVIRICTGPCHQFFGSLNENFCTINNTSFLRIQAAESWRHRQFDSFTW